MVSATSFYTEEELSSLGLSSYGRNVLISRFARLYSCDQICIGDNVRIDDFCILSGKIKIGSNVHIAAYCALYGANGIEFMDNSGCSARTTIYSVMDDFSGDYLVGPMQPKHLTNVSGGKVTIGEYAQLGANCVVFPNLTIGEGAVVGAMSLVKKDVPEWKICAGIPVKVIKDRKRNLLYGRNADVCM